MKEQWIEELRQKMADYKEPAPEVSWEEIEQAVSGAKRQARVVPMWLRRIAAAILVLIMVFVGYKALDHVKHTDRSLDLSQNQAPVPSTIHAEEPALDTPAEKPLLAKVSQKVRQARQSWRQSWGQAPESGDPQAASPQDSQTPEVATVEQTSEESQSSQNQETRTEQKKADTYHHQTIIYPSDLHKSPTLRNRLTAKVYLSNAMGNSGNISSWSNSYEKSMNDPGYEGQQGEPGEKGDKGDKGEGYTNFNGGEHGDGNDDENEEEKDGNNKTRESDGGGATTTETITTTQDTHHYQPIRYGLSLRYRLNERWSIETGLTYSLLTSDITMTTGEQTTQLKQRLNYLGIPLKAEYLLWDSRYFNVYIAAGTMVEKMVKGRLENIGTGTKEGVSIRPLQFSLNGAVGAEFNFSRQFSIYAEPGIGYYFDNGSSVSTFYQDKPLSFSLNLGLRFQISGK